MKVSAINNNNYAPDFGHSFRVSICINNPSGVGDIFVNPHSEKNLYKLLNSKIVGWLNEDYLSGLRRILGKERKVSKTKPLNDIHRDLVEQLKRIDPDYARFGAVRSVYNQSKLGYIATGIDVPIIENIKGIKNIGIAKADAKWYTGNTNSEYVKQLSKLVKGNVLDYVQNPSVLLRSKDNKEIMLKAVFKEIKKNKKGSPVYSLDRFEFHENKTLPDLPPINSNFMRYKYNPSMSDEILRTINYQASAIAGRKVHFNSINEFLGH